MIFIYLYFYKPIFALVSLFLIKMINTQVIEELIKPKCDYKTINYSILANLEEYLQFQNNIDGKEMFESIEIFQFKKLGAISET